ncbi:sodium/calcium exchanger membrane protein [Natrinema pellirubrum DSM 15624]|uniref:Ca2+/Na+ antiporter n=1 Tax=Natrinema pellirubrum (strain DSM 15624 / CIP 106293 / JCM 10476 / NCIMB 786 / 157) TaxID=797303 RepID=L0JJI2_NATP1|nr:sodium:calcium antiporter [Natrinema pellirubrum]AGB31429.1 Ca2+/Na+ antiporter [Natrinema pellirubrum DSM 15624]ELY82018.1 sodium/calcium exchanger membrane protein [Natrinema pellirubrum DSM 15624]
MVVPSSPVALVALFLVGVVLVIWCVEVFIEAVARSAVSLGLSGFFLAVVLAGIDLENAVLGVTAAFVALPDLALGTVFGESLFVLAVAVGLAGLLVPFRTAVPRAYLLMLVLVPLPAFALSLDGRLTPLEGAGLLVLFVPLLGYIFRRERRTETTFLLSAEVQDAVPLEGGAEPRPETPDGGDLTASESDGQTADDGWDLDLDEFVPAFEDRSGLFNLGVAALAVAGMTIGSGITVVSAEAIFVALGISGLAFGATVLSFIASLEELALTVEPVRRNRPELAVGNVIGSTVFYVTANVGIVAAVHPIETGGDVLTIHWPFLGVCLLVATAMLARGRVGRVGGLLLCGLYAAYWVANYL